MPAPSTAAPLALPVPSPAEARRLDEKERRREAVLDAAEAVLREEGFDAARMDQIARRARVSRALVYLYFKDKRALQLGIGLRALGVLRERFAAVRRRHRLGADQIRGIGRDYVAFASEFPVYFEAISRVEGERAELSEPGSLGWQLLEAGRLVHAETVTALLSGQQDGSLRADLGDPLQVSMSLWGFMHGVAQLAMTKGEIFLQQGILTERFVDDSVEMAMRSVAR